MCANVYMWSTCGHNFTKTSLWQIVHLHAFTCIIHLSPQPDYPGLAGFLQLATKGLQASLEGKSKSVPSGSIPEWPEALCHNSADALHEGKVERELSLVQTQCAIQSYHIQILCG